MCQSVQSACSVGTVILYSSENIRTGFIATAQIRLRYYGEFEF